MSSKKATSKETKTVEKKPATKSAAKASAKTEKKATTKTATASAAKKSAAEATKETKVTEKKAASKAESKVTKKAETKAPAEKKSVAKSPKAEAKPVEKKKADEAKKAADSKKSGVKVASSDASKSPKKPANEYDYAELLVGVKKLSKSIMFVEVDEQEDRSNKKKMSSEMKNLEMRPTSSIRRKSSLAEETQEELTERILKELEEQNMAFEREAASQMCTRCNRNLVSPEFWVDKHLGYCEECAMILKLGQSKEARKVEYQLGSMGGDSLDEEDDEIEGPDADDLKDAEEDLDEMDV